MDQANGHSKPVLVKTGRLRPRSRVVIVDDSSKKQTPDAKNEPKIQVIDPMEAVKNQAMSQIDINNHDEPRSSHLASRKQRGRISRSKQKTKDRSRGKALVKRARDIFDK